MARYPTLADRTTPKWLSQARTNRGLTIVATALLLCLIATILLLWIPGKATSYRANNGGEGHELLRDTQNSTLGFQKLLVINYDDRTDKRDKMALMAATTGLHFDFFPAVKAEDVPNKAMPPNGIGWLGGVRGSWRAHINALRSIVEQNLTSAVIFEDDIDWDIRIKQQMHDYALTTRALTQPLAKDPSKFADPTFPDVLDPAQSAPQVDAARLPRTTPPKSTPYGDNWDLLWLGHCGMRRPMTHTLINLVGVDEDWYNISASLPKGVIVQHNDVTVPKKQHLHWWNDGPFEEFRRNFPEHSRITHHAVGAVCTFAYAVTQAGARKALYEMGIMPMVDPFDLMLRDFCDRKRGHEGNGARCLTVQPSLFSHFIRKEDGQEGGQWKRTLNVRWSTWANLKNLVKGETDYLDQWPDH